MFCILLPARSYYGRFLCSAENDAFTFLYPHRFPKDANLKIAITAEVPKTRAYPETLDRSTSRFFCRCGQFGTDFWTPVACFCPDAKTIRSPAHRRPLVAFRVRFARFGQWWVPLLQCGGVDGLPVGFPLRFGAVCTCRRFSPRRDQRQVFGSAQNPTYESTRKVMEIQFFPHLFYYLLFNWVLLLF